jgi:hypothetical protein
MCTPRSWRLARIVIAAVITACGGEPLTLPGESGPAALTAVSGYDQEGTVGSRLNEPLVAKVTDSDSRPLAGVPIVFRFQSEVPGAEVDPAQAETDAQGVASAQVRLGESTGSQIVEAQVAQASGSDLLATFPLTAVAEEKGKKDKGGERGGHGDDDEDNDDEDDDDD